MLRLNLTCIVSKRNMSGMCIFFFFFSSRRRHTRCALVTGVQTCALPIYALLPKRACKAAYRLAKRASARKRAKGRLKAADEDGEDRIGVDAAQKPLERLGKAVIHVHRVGHGGVDSGSTDRLDRLDGKLPRHIEPSRRTSDVCEIGRA